MPELPDVEVFRQYVEKTSLDKKISHVTIKGERVMQADPDTFIQTMTGNTFYSACRHGKYLFVELETIWMYIHFGMSGQLKYFKIMGKEPEHDRVLFTFENGYHLAYDCQRRLGKIDLIGDVDEFITEKGLGPDALTVDESTFLDRVQGKRGYIKSALMNQNLIAGVGNIFSDEILFQARFHPKTKVRTLNKDDLKKVYTIMKEVLHTGVQCKAEEEKFPDTYIIPHRERGGKCPLCGTNVKRIKVSGRSSYFCPEHQSKK